jgi:hypothetical protein
MDRGIPRYLHRNWPIWQGKISFARLIRSLEHWMGMIMHLAKLVLPSPVRATARLCHRPACAAHAHRLRDLPASCHRLSPAPTPWLTTWHPSQPHQPPLPPRHATIKGATPVAAIPFFFLFFLSALVASAAPSPPCPLVHLGHQRAISVVEIRATTAVFPLSR